MNLRIALLQLLPGDTPGKQLETGKQACIKAKEMGADIAQRTKSSGEDFYVADLNTSKGPIKFGSMICFDREFPESARVIMMKGAEIILAPNACPMEVNRLSALRTRAYENMVCVATCNYPEGQPDCNGHSTVFDGVAWLRDEPGVRDMCILVAPGEAGVYVADVNMDQLREYRAHEVMGNNFRHPGTYWCDSW